MESHGIEDDLEIQIDDNLENSMSFELNNIDNIGVGTSSNTNIHNIGVGISSDTIILLIIMILIYVWGIMSKMKAIKLVLVCMTYY